MRTKPQSCLGFVFLNTWAYHIAVLKKTLKWAYHKSNTIAVLKKTLK